jgi:membrane-associated protein
MGLITGLHGAVAIVLLCSLLLVEEAGVPLPFAPGELTLLAAGLLIATGGLQPYLFVPLAFVACSAGALVGFSWAQVVGERGLAALAARIHQQKALGKVERRIRAATPLDVAVSRLIPGLRIYTTLVAGALGVRRRDFLLGMLPSTALWVVVWVALGTVVGIPLEHLFTKVSSLALQGAILVVIGVGGYLAIRRAPAGQRESLVRLPAGVRTGLAVAVDVTVVASILTGLAAIARRVSGVGPTASWADLAVVVAAIAALYLFLTRQGAGATVGEALLRTQYLPHRGERSVRASLRAAVGADHLDPQLQAASDLLHVVGGAVRLGLLRALLERPRSATDLASVVHLPVDEATYHLRALSQAGLVLPIGPSQETYEVAEGWRSWLSELMRAARAAVQE